MAGKLPEYQSRSFVENIGVVRARRPDMSGLGSLVGALKTMNAENEREKVARAQVEGGNAVTRDENGRLQIQPLDFSDAEARARTNAMITRYMTEIENDARRQASEMALNHQDTPDGFSEIWTGHMTGVKGEVPEELQGRVQSIYQSIGRQQYTSLLTKKDNRDYALAQSAWEENLKSKADDVNALATAGMHGTDAYLEAISEYEASLGDGIGSRFINDEHADVMRQRVADNGEALAISVRAVEVYREAGGGNNGRAAAEKELQEIIEDPDLNIPENRRLRIVEIARRQIRQAETIRAGQLVEVRAEAADIERRLQLGFPVDPGKVVEIAGRAEELGDHEYAKDLRASMDLQAEVEAFGLNGLKDQRLTLKAMIDQANDPNASAADAERAIAFQKAHAIKAKALASDAFAYGIEAYERDLGVITPLDFSQKHEEVAGVLKARLKAAQHIQDLDGVPVIPMTVGEIDRLAGVIETSPAGDQALLMATLADGLGPEYLPAVMEKLIDKGGQVRTFTTAAGLSQADAGLGRDVLFGNEVRQDNKKLVPENNLAFRQVVQDELGNVLALRPDALASITDAAQALYAKASLDAGDLTGTLDTERLEGALNRITGGVVEWNGRKVIVPQRGMSQDVFSALMEGLEDQDLGENVPKSLDGNPITAEMIKKYGELYSVGDGRYIVRMAGFDIPDPDNTARAWELDLTDVPVRAPVVDEYSENVMNDYIFQQTGMMP